jgi:hypothetical protein
MPPRQGLCRALGFPTKVLAAALVFLKRFYLAFSVLDHDPKNFMLTCIYLAGKARPELSSPESRSRSWSPRCACAAHGRVGGRAVAHDGKCWRRASGWCAERCTGFAGACWEGRVGLATLNVPRWCSSSCLCRAGGCMGADEDSGHALS